MGKSSLDVQESLFWGERKNNILVLSFKDNQFSHLIDLNFKKTLLEYLDFVSCCDDIKVILIKASPVRMERKEFLDFHKKLMNSASGNVSLERIYNGINQIILQLINLNKIVIYVDSGKISLLRMNIGLACDYRIISDDTIYQNLNIDLDLLPKGGGAFFLSRMLGRPAARKILLTREDISAQKALSLGMVDEVAPLAELDQRAMATAERLSGFPVKYFIGVKKLLNYDAKDLDKYLEYENELIRRQIDCSNLANEGIT
jgi:2-(1,2-epoxy-1,2-dihydrophenyl)acetyl-CoA isomerase